MGVAGRRCLEVTPDLLHLHPAMLACAVPKAGKLFGLPGAPKRPRSPGALPSLNEPLRSPLGSGAAGVLRDSQHLLGVVGASF